jgi:bla regulator protein BlaR1
MPIRCSRIVREPSVCGIFRSVLMWPEGLSGHLDDEHLSAIVMHELVHVRNRDNLIAALHMIVEAVFWFHPLVWWIERKILLERENVCDESVVRRLGNAEVYAVSLLKVSHFCVEPSPAYVSGAAGADLRKRIVNIVTYRSVTLNPTRTVMLILFGLATLVIPLALGMIHALPVYGQVLYRDGPLPSFEVATVKPMPNGQPPTPAPPGGSIVHLFVTPKMLVMYAYNLPDFSEDQIERGPGWMNETYEVQGKISDEEYAANAKDAGG